MLCFLSCNFSRVFICCFVFGSWLSPPFAVKLPLSPRGSPSQGLGVAERAPGAGISLELQMLHLSYKLTSLYRVQKQSWTPGAWIRPVHGG